MTTSTDTSAHTSTDTSAHTSTDTTGLTGGAGVPMADDLVALGGFEACAEHRGPDADGPCGHCGWLAADHTAGLAPVIRVGRPATVAPLRRAS